MEVKITNMLRKEEESSQGRLAYLLSSRIQETNLEEVDNHYSLFSNNTHGSDRDTVPVKCPKLGRSYSKNCWTK